MRKLSQRFLLGRPLCGNLVVFKLYSKSVLLKFIMHTYLLGTLSHGRFYSVTLGWNLRFCTATKLSGDADDHFEEGLWKF